MLERDDEEECEDDRGQLRGLALLHTAMLEGSGDLESIDEHFVRLLRTRSQRVARRGQVRAGTAEDTASLRLLFDAQVQSRHLDFAARWLQS